MMEECDKESKLRLNYGNTVNPPSWSLHNSPNEENSDQTRNKLHKKYSPALYSTVPVPAASRYK